MISKKELYQKIEICPWCNGDKYIELYAQTEGNMVRKCANCGLVYASKILNEDGRKEYWGKYESEIHQKTQKLTECREKMYKMEYDFISPFLHKKNRILDVGCGGGEFLGFFKSSYNECEGIEFGEEAYKKASQKYKVYLGELPKCHIEGKFDLIIFRGTIQYFIKPKLYFDRAVELLNSGGLIYITSSPNSDSLCFNLFKERFTQPVSSTDYCMYNERILTQYFQDKGMEKVVRHDFYLGTPYEDYENDIQKVVRGLELRKQKKDIRFDAPSFFDNMLTLLYRKNE